MVFPNKDFPLPYEYSIVVGNNCILKVKVFLTKQNMAVKANYFSETKEKS